MNVDTTIGRLFSTDIKVQYEYYKSDDLLILTSAKVGTNTLKSFFQHNNIDYVVGGFEYNLTEDSWEQSNEQNEPDVDIPGLLQNDTIQKIIIFRNPKIKAVSGMLEDFSGEISKILSINYGISLIKQKYQLDAISEYILADPDISIEHLVNVNPDLAHLLFKDWFYSILKDGDLIVGHGKPICSSLYWLLDTEKITVNKNTKFIDLDDISTGKLGDVLKELYPKNTFRFHLTNNSRKKQYILMDEILSKGENFKGSAWYQILSARINSDYKWYVRLKDKYQSGE